MASTGISNLVAAAADLLRALGIDSVGAALSRRRLLARLRTVSAADAVRRAVADFGAAAPPPALALAVAGAAAEFAGSEFACDDDELTLRLQVVNEVLRAARGVMIVPADGSASLVFRLEVARWDINFVGENIPSYLSDYSCDSE
jgi:hypothetical protein